MGNRLVNNWMTTPVITVTPGTKLSEARKIMSEKQIRALPVMDGEKLIGIITRRGLLRLDLSNLVNETWNKSSELAEENVGEVMTFKPLTTTPNSPVAKAARIMLENKITALPVAEKEKLLGIFTNSDVFRFLLAEYDSLMQKVLVENYMTDEVITIERDTSLLEAHRLMGTKRIRSLPVMEDEKLIGIVTRTDLMGSDPSRMASRNNQELSLKILTQPVEKIMTSPVKSISPQADICTAAQIMLENKYHVLPVLNAEQKLVGIISESDLFLFVVQKFL
jgi:CBS domain-containing protein